MSRADRSSPDPQTRPPTQVGPEPDQRVAVTAAELVARYSWMHAPLVAGELERWLVGRQLATVDADGCLSPTALGRQLGAGLVAWRD